MWDRFIRRSYMDSHLRKTMTQDEYEAMMKLRIGMFGVIVPILLIWQIMAL